MQGLPQNCKAPHKKNQGAAGLRQLPENELGGYQMNCMICHLDKKKHSKDLWKLHQQPSLCTFCNKSGSEHSEELWEMHKAAVEKGQFCIDHKKKEKLYPITVGFGRKGIARVCRINADPPHDVDFVPIYMSCTKCGLYLGSIEEDCADVLDGMCLVCFREVTDQPGSWCGVSTTEYPSKGSGKKPRKKKNRDHIKIDQKSTVNALSTVPEKRRGRK